MVGRAGRPGYDDKGIAVVMTSFEDKCIYDFSSSEMETVESSLHNHLAEGCVLPFQEIPSYHTK